MTHTTIPAGGIEEGADTKPKSRTVTRVQMDLPPRSMERLTALKEKTEAASYAEVIKNTLRLYEALVEEADQGNEFLVRDRNGTVTPYRLFL
jgi:hypothetical protein